MLLTDRKHPDGFVERPRNLSEAGADAGAEAGTNPTGDEEMSRQISIFSLILAAALACGAIMAPVAAAGTGVEFGNTGFTCLAGAGDHNTNADCETATSGNFGHQPIAENEETGWQLTKITNFELRVKIGLPNVVLTATGVECLNCMLKNQTDAGVMDVTGTGKVKFTGVTVNIKNCSVPFGVFETKPLKLTTLTSEKATFEPQVGTVVAEIVVEGIGCSLPSPIKVEGHADATSNGARLAFNTGAGMLKVGTQTAFLVGEATVTSGVTGAEYHAFSLTSA
jgi:hypothetical protein